MADIPEEPPDENEQYESLDESLDAEDVSREGGPEGQRDLDSELVLDRAALAEIGADLDDPDRIALLDSMDDPDGSGPWDPEDAPDAGFDVDPAAADRATGVDADPDDPAEPDAAPDPQLEEVDTDATAMDQVPEDQPGPDSARW